VNHARWSAWEASAGMRKINSPRFDHIMQNADRSYTLREDM
jgi:hypothetical protein